MPTTSFDEKRFPVKRVSFTLEASNQGEQEMTPTTPRLPPIDPSDWNDEQKEALQGMGNRSNVLNIFKTLAHHPKLAKKMACVC